MVEHDGLEIQLIEAAADERAEYDSMRTIHVLIVVRSPRIEANDQGVFRCASKRSTSITMSPRRRPMD